MQKSKHIMMSTKLLTHIPLISFIDLFSYHQLDVNGQPLKGISIRLFKTINLRSGDWFGGKNDVYVQVCIARYILCYLAIASFFPLFFME